MAVLGGGPAGLAASIQGAQQGLSVTLFEKNKVGENIKCAEGFYDSMKLFGPPSHGALFKVDCLHIKVKDEYKVDCSNVNLWMIDRQTWQKGLKEEAMALGVDVKENCPVNPTDLVSISQNYDWVIDCTGIPSTTSISKGFSHVYKNYWAYAHQITLFGNFQNQLGELKVGVSPDYLGYYWIFPKSKDFANVGLGIFPQNNKYPETLKKRLKRELHNIIHREGLQNCKKVRKTGGVIPTKPLDELVFDNIILAGDSGGFSSPLHGGGIDLALFTGKEAINAINEGEIDNYRQRLLDKAGAKLEIEQKIFDLWEQIGYENLDRLLRLILKREAVFELPRLFQFRDLLISERQTITAFYDGFFQGNWDRISY
ncbi:FAD dependent oxidoreductase [Natranaerobius thermophilus JW/NM-WN-LF]|uniref:FAD dependent oxidoreductase n=1 Tax=Natranaerobius thermophilus (strain ATCC BAA-1301 / DSM 18059 / JW/NM-WN-LF) TaxID=457570 RepID=B2A5J1_NATTJ|nr:FAD dependent oxidoreductase [Natranaerobius thermophilus JW/NM-WN-LF]